MRIFKCVILSAILAPLIALNGCGSSSGVATVAIQRVNNLYYNVEINMPSASHYQIGRQYALRIKSASPNFESEVDAGLEATVEMMKAVDPTITMQVLIDRALVIFENVPDEYKEEIRGLQSVFSGENDTLGTGQLSQNKLLVYELAPDVTRLVSCSASAAFGSATNTGKTIIGRNLEWHDEILPYMATQQSVTILRNGSKSIVYFGFLGQIYPVSGFNSSSLFASILDSDVGTPYYLEGSERSYVMDLRYALENYSTIDDIASFFSEKDYAYNFDIFLADTTVSKVLEVDIDTPFTGLRTSTSALKTDTEVEILPWNYPEAIACVNWFSLPGTVDNTDFWEGNAPRWSSFIDLYGEYQAQGAITIDTMKAITGYSGTGGTGKAMDGAIWRYDDGESEVQSIIMDMNTLETWVSFQPEGQPVLHSPNYIQIFSGSPF